MRRLLLASLLLGAALAEEAPDYSNRVNIYNGSDMGGVPHANFVNADALRQYQQDAAQCRKNGGQGSSASCPKYEFTVPYSLDSSTQKVGRNLRAAWGRFEDRYYWRALVELNNPVMLLSHCTLDWGSGVSPQIPELKTFVDKGILPRPLQRVVPSGAPDDKLHLDTYGLSPQVKNADYCDGLQVDLTLMYLPGTCIYAGATKLFCIEGSTETMNPLAPRPLYWNEAAAEQRVQRAIEHAHETYLPQYQEDAVKALAPSAGFSPLPWGSIVPEQGAVVAPTMSLKPDVETVSRTAQEAAGKLSGVFKGTAYSYYAQGLAGPSRVLRAHILPGSQDALKSPPGVWKLEEFKRRLAPNALPLYERFGYSTLFQSWGELRETFLPEPASAKPLRQMIYMATGSNIYLPSLAPVPVPAPILLKKYAAGLPFAGPQTRFGWVSVPEGYSVPRVTGTPTFDYGAVTK